jgi:DUF971 family protein
MTKNEPRPVTINYHQNSKLLEISFDDGAGFELSSEYLRVYSPSAEVKGHGPGQAILQVGKENVAISEIEPVGNYAVRLHFDDGHNTGLYTWSYLYELGTNLKNYWQNYLVALEHAGHQRQTHD